MAAAMAAQPKELGRNQMKDAMWNHEFRTYQGKPDFLYQNMMMCRDKSWLAVSRQRLSREEQIAACLHDLQPGVWLQKESGDFSIELEDWSSHHLYEYSFVEGSFEEKLQKLHELLAEGKEAYIGTIHPLLPFSARYYPALNTAHYQQPNHIFVILGEENGRYIYFDTSSIHSAGYVPYPRNPELGWIEQSEVDAVLRQMFQLAYVEWHDENRSRLKEYGHELLAAYAAGYRQEQALKYENEEERLYRGRRAIQLLMTCLSAPELDLSAPDTEYDFIEQGDILNWKLTDLATRRKVMAEWLGEESPQLKKLMEASGVAWERLSTLVLYRRQRRKYGNDARYARLLSEIMSLEDKIYIFLTK